MEPFRYKSIKDFEERCVESQMIMQKYPKRVPIIVEKQYQCTLPEISKHKYLTPNDVTLGQFMHVVRKRIEISEKDAIFVFINGRMLNMSNTMVSVYEKEKADDGFLYVEYSSENTFGFQW